MMLLLGFSTLILVISFGFLALARSFIHEADYKLDEASKIYECMKWKPIETAIRHEETPILIRTRTYGACEAWFFKGDDEGGPCWVCCDDIFQIEVEYAEHGYYDGEAIQWMPLPVPLEE